MAEFYIILCNNVVLVSDSMANTDFNFFKITLPEFHNGQYQICYSNTVICSAIICCKIANLN